MKKREMFVFCVFGSSSRFIKKRGGMRALSRIPPFRGVGSTLPFPPYTCRTAQTQVGTEFLELPLACCLCSKFIPKTI